jgi:hypothetical protein
MLSVVVILARKDENPTKWEATDAVRIGSASLQTCFMEAHPNELKLDCE